MTNKEKFIEIFGLDAWNQMIEFSGISNQFKEYWDMQVNIDSKMFEPQESEEKK